MVTDAVQISIDVDYRVHGFAVTFTPAGGSAVPDTLVIDNMSDVIFTQVEGDKPGHVALEPRVNIRETDLSGAAPEEATLLLTDERWLDIENTTWKVKTSKRISRYEHELTLAKVTTP